jgi:hypothetical protein
MVKTIASSALPLLAFTLLFSMQFTSFSGITKLQIRKIYLSEKFDYLLPCLAASLLPNQ